MLIALLFCKENLQAKQMPDMQLDSLSSEMVIDPTATQDVLIDGGIHITLDQVGQKSCGIEILPEAKDGQYIFEDQEDMGGISFYFVSPDGEIVKEKRNLFYTQASGSCDQELHLGFCIPWKELKKMKEGSYVFKAKVILKEKEE